MNLNEHLQPLPTELLIAMAKGEIDAKAVAVHFVAERGLMRMGNGSDLKRQLISGWMVGNYYWAIY